MLTSDLICLQGLGTLLGQPKEVFSPRFLVEAGSYFVAGERVRPPGAVRCNPDAAEQLRVTRYARALWDKKWREMAGERAADSERA